MFNTTPAFGVPYNDTDEVAIGTVGEKIAATSIFDGWGYTHLLRNSGEEMVPVDHFAIDEGLDPRFGEGDFGDLSVHEFATDPTEYLAYSAYYAGGMRVLRFGDAGLRAGRQVHRRGRKQLLGRGAVHDASGRPPVRGLRPRLRAVPVPLHRTRGGQEAWCARTPRRWSPFKGSATVPLTCADANANALKESVLSSPQSGALSGDPDSGAVTYTHSGEFGGTGRFVHLQGERRRGRLECRDGQPGDGAGQRRALRESVRRHRTPKHHHRQRLRRQDQQLGRK